MEEIFKQLPGYALMLKDKYKTTLQVGDIVNVYIDVFNKNNVIQGIIKYNNQFYIQLEKNIYLPQYLGEASEYIKYNKIFLNNIDKELVIDSENVLIISRGVDIYNKCLELYQSNKLEHLYHILLNLYETKQINISMEMIQFLKRAKD